MQNDVEVFLEQCEQAANSCNFDNVAPFIATDAVFWFTNGTYRGRNRIQKAFEETWSKIREEVYTISNVERVVDHDTDAVCVYDFSSDGLVEGKRQICKGRGTSILIKE